MRSLPILLVALTLATCAGRTDATGERIGQPPANVPLVAPDTTPGGFLRFERAIPMPGVEGRFDHMTYDPKTGIVYLAALGNNSVERIDLTNGKLLGHAVGFDEPTGVAFVPELRRLFVAEAGGRVTAYDDSSLERVFSTSRRGEMARPTAVFDGIPDADNVRYDSSAAMLYVAYGDGGLTLIDARKLERVADIETGGHPEAFSLAPGSARGFANVPSERSVAVIDLAKRTVIGRWDLQGAAANYPMTLDESGGRLYVGCRNPATILVYDVATGGQLMSIPIDGDIDDLFLDHATGRLFAICGAGYVDVVMPPSVSKPVGRVRDPDVLARLPTASGARTGLLIPVLHRLLVAVPRRGSQRAEVRVYELGGD